MELKKYLTLILVVLFIKCQGEEEVLPVEEDLGKWGVPEDRGVAKLNKMNIK